MTETSGESFDTELVENAGAVVQRIRAEIARVVIGQDHAVDQVLMALLAGGHVLIEGVPGLGKTLLVRALAQTFGGSFSRIQFTPDLMPADITGHALYDTKSEQFRIRRGPVFANLLLADEINRAPAKTQAALLEAMQEYQVSIEGQSMALAPPFMTLATQNPLEQEGTYPLPEAQMDRFLLKVLIDYPAEAEEMNLVVAVTDGRVGDTLNVSEVETVVRPETILGIQKLVASLRVDPAVSQYAVRIVRQTRVWSGLARGAGPRGGIALVRTARARALLSGRDFVTPDDVKSVAVAALRHRIALRPELEIEGRTADEVLHDMLDHVEAPRA
jgi:MoxR-like ATPase